MTNISKSLAAHTQAQKCKEATYNLGSVYVQHSGLTVLMHFPI